MDHDFVTTLTMISHTGANLLGELGYAKNVCRKTLSFMPVYEKNEPCEYATFPNPLRQPFLCFYPHDGNGASIGAGAES